MLLLHTFTKIVVVVLLLHTFTKVVVVVLLLMLLLLLLLLFPHNMPAQSSAVFQSTTCVSPRVSVLLHHNCCGALHWGWGKIVEHFCGSIASERILIVKLYFGALLLLLNSVFGSWVIALLHHKNWGACGALWNEYFEPQSTIIKQSMVEHFAWK